MSVDPGRGAPIRLSRLASPALRTELRQRHQIIEVPAVRGRTAWEYGDPSVLAVVESPNWVGRIEAPPATVPVRWRRIEPDPARVALAGRLCKSLVQLAGVSAPWTAVEAPWFAIAVSCAPELVADQIPGAQPIGLPELPGGLRVELPEDASPDIVRQYAAGFAAAMARIREGG